MLAPTRQTDDAFWSQPLATLQTPLEAKPAGLTSPVYLLAVEGVKRWFYRSRLSKGLVRPSQNILLDADR